jgi:ABC-2 type transport system ATP-binding protein
MSIEVNNISKSYGTQKALDNISFTVKKGEIVGFLGPNGAGKSTLMKILTTYITADEGTAAVNGFDVNTQAKAVQQSIGYLPEHNPLYLDLYVREYLAFNADVYKVAKSRIEEVIQLTGLSTESHKKIGQSYSMARSELVQAVLSISSVCDSSWAHDFRYSIRIFGNLLFRGDTRL